jgi:integrase
MQRLNEEVVKALPPPQKGNRITFFPDAVLQGVAVPRGFGVRVTAGGARSFVLTYRIKQKQFRYTIGQWPDWSPLRAVKEARGLRQRIDRGENPLEDRAPAAAPAGEPFEGVAKEYFLREGGKLRTLADRRATLERLVYPKLGARQIDDIKRSDIVRLLDEIEDERGPRMASLTLAYLRRIMNWHESRADDFRSPIVRGMARGATTTRDRVLTDDELSVVWQSADKLATPFARFLQFILLTGVRRNEAARMTTGELDGTDWLIPAARVKGKRDFLVPLSGAAMAVLAALPGRGTDPGPVFTNDGHRPLRGFGKAKEAFDKACGVTGWTIHDLRRTARTLLTRAGVQRRPCRTLSRARHRRRPRRL